MRLSEFLISLRARRRKPAPVLRPPEALVLPEIIVPEPVIESTTAALRSFNTDDTGHEGIVYWAGIQGPERLLITICVVPEAETTVGSYHTSVMANAEVISVVNRYGVNLVGQVHTHPDAWVDHSQGDVIGAFMPYEGFLSIVVPHYAKRGMLPLSEFCGVHFYHHGHFIRLRGREVEDYFRIVPTIADLR